MQNDLRIGEVAKRADVSIDTVRYYERQGLLPVAPRTRAGYRVFTSDTIERVLFIKQAQELGFSLGEINELLTPGGAEECGRVRDLLKHKLTELDGQMQKIKKFRGLLSNHLAHCEAELQAKGSDASCPVLIEIGHHQ